MRLLRREPSREDVLGYFSSARHRWAGTSPQQDTFTELLQIIRFPDPTVLDAGCGSGDLAEHVPHGLYTGVDISEPSIRKARVEYPVHRFVVADVMDVVGGFDYVVASSLFARTHHPHARLLRKLWRLCTYGVAFTYPWRGEDAMRRFCERSFPVVAYPESQRSPEAVFFLYRSKPLIAS